MPVSIVSSPRFLFIALAVSTVMMLHPALAHAQAATASGLDPVGTSSANGGVLASADTNVRANNATQTSSDIANDNLRAQQRSNAQVSANSRSSNNTRATTNDFNSTTRVGDGQGNLSVGTTLNGDLGSNGVANTAGNLNNSVGVNNSTGTGINATVGAGTAGARSGSSTSSGVTGNTGASTGVGVGIR